MARAVDSLEETASLKLGAGDVPVEPVMVDSEDPLDTSANDWIPLGIQDRFLGHLGVHHIRLRFEPRAAFAEGIEGDSMLTARVLRIGLGRILGIRLGPKPSAGAPLTTARARRSRARASGVLASVMVTVRARLTDEPEETGSEERNRMAVRHYRRVAEFVDEVADEASGPVGRETARLPLRLFDEYPLRADERAALGIQDRFLGHLGVHHVGPAGLQPVVLSETRIDARADSVRVRPPLVIPVTLAPSVEVNDEGSPVTSFPRELAEGLRRGPANPLDRTVMAVGRVVPFLRWGDNYLTERTVRSEPLGRGVPLKLPRDLESFIMGPFPPAVGDPQLALMSGVGGIALFATPQLAIMNLQRKASIARKPADRSLRTTPGPPLSTTGEDRSDRAPFSDEDWGGGGTDISAPTGRIRG